MVKGGLRDRIAKGLTDEVAPPQDPAKLLEDLARALKLAADRASSVRPSPPRGSMPPDAQTLGDPNSIMPQILQVRSQRMPVSEETPGRPGKMFGRLAERTTVGPVVLVAGLATVGLMLLVSVQEAASPRDIASRVTVLSSLEAIGFRTPSTMTTAAVDVYVADGSEVASSDRQALPVAKSESPLPADSSSLNSTMANGVRIVSVVRQPKRDDKESRLLSNSAALIQQGNIKGARDALARAASEGSLNAKFALAETFDPNMLAAWGRSEQVGDVKIALKLYEQVLARGESRASRRIGALKGDR